MTERRERLEGLDPRAMAALRAFRDEDEMPQAARERVWERVAAETAGPARQGGKARSSGTWAALLLAAAAVVLVGSQVGVLGPRVAAREDAAAEFAGPPAEPAPVVARPAGGAPAASEAPGPGPKVQALEPAAGPGAAGEERSVVTRVPERRSEASGPSGKVAAEDAGEGLVEEAEALARAQAAIAGARPEAALGELASYARRFPRGALREEHDALRAIALCAAGRSREGRGAAQVFLRERGGSALAERVRGACLAGE